MLEETYKELIKNVKNDILSTRNKVIENTNNELINLYFRLGKIISENSKYGSNFIQNMSISLKLEFPNLKGFSSRNLRNMKLFYEEYKEDEIWQQTVAKLPWGHNMLLIEKVKNKKVRKIYALATVENNWSRNILAIQIDTQYHMRIGKSSNNFNNILPKEKSDLINNAIKDPYIFNFISLDKSYKEKELETEMILHE